MSDYTTKLIAILLICVPVLLWSFAWTFYRAKRYISKKIYPNQWKVLGISGAFSLIIVLSGVLIVLLH